MMFRDDLYQANRRIERAELELQQARTDRDHLSGTPDRKPSVDLAPLEWVPVIATPLLAVVALVTWLGGLDSRADLPLGWLFASGLAGGTLYSIDVLLRWKRGDRTVLNRLLVVFACIAGAPALLMGFLLFGWLMGYLVPIAVIGWVIHWIVKG